MYLPLLRHGSERNSACIVRLLSVYCACIVRNLQENCKKKKRKPHNSICCALMGSERNIDADSANFVVDSVVR